MEINALLLNFEKQLHISEHEKTILFSLVFYIFLSIVATHKM